MCSKPGVLRYTFSKRLITAQTKHRPKSFFHQCNATPSSSADILSNLDTISRQGNELYAYAGIPAAYSTPQNKRRPSDSPPGG